MIPHPFRIERKGFAQMTIKLAKYDEFKSPGPPFTNMD